VSQFTNTNWWSLLLDNLFLAGWSIIFFLIYPQAWWIAWMFTRPKVTKPETETLYLQDRDVWFFQALETKTFNLQDRDYIPVPNPNPNLTCGSVTWRGAKTEESRFLVTGELPKTSQLSCDCCYSALLVLHVCVKEGYLSHLIWYGLSTTSTQWWIGVFRTAHSPVAHCVKLSNSYNIYSFKNLSFS